MAHSQRSPGLDPCPWPPPSTVEPYGGWLVFWDRGHVPAYVSEFSNSEFTNLIEGAPILAPPPYPRGPRWVSLRPSQPSLIAHLHPNILQSSAESSSTHLDPQPQLIMIVLTEPVSCWQLIVDGGAGS
ncbi:unnamed protein product [Pleuronectes platessa]|uniref:Uncharacterized protein n=1 Tax=Pleuronectes platessa TaxID=8262 RepID=A0A9N7VNQ3_PLEPL|nr:unnamed protein product [Pleuronectes platessa]